MHIDAAAFDRYMAAKHVEDAALQTPSISQANAALLVGLLRQKRAKHILEIGTCHGTSTCYLARAAAAWGGKILSYEISEVSYLVAQQHFEALGLKNIDLRRENALEALRSRGKTPNAADETCFTQKFDWVFIDAQKSRTLDFYLAVQPHLAPQAVVVVDDVMKYQNKMAQFWQYLETHKLAYTLHTVDQDDATMVIQQP